MNYEHNVSAAGIVLFRRVGMKCEFLGLTALDIHQKRCGGKFDITKGRIDPGETAIQAAYRECQEEAGITPERLIAGPFSDGSLVVWLGEVDDYDEVKLIPNKHTGELEHKGYEWLTPNEISNKCLGYLKKYVDWACKEALKYTQVKW